MFSACIILVLDATFVLNLTFLSLLSPEISFREKTDAVRYVMLMPTHSLRHPAYFAIREAQCSALRNKFIVTKFAIAHHRLFVSIWHA